jgi:CIC family chloride channel protein
MARPGVLTIAVASVIAAVGVVLAFLLTQRIAPEAAGSGVPEVEGALEGLREVRWRQVLPVKFVGGVLGLSSGLVAGREGPTIHIGAAIGAFLAERLRFARWTCTRCSLPAPRLASPPPATRRSPPSCS